jgi:hypothetical protein
MLKRNKMKNFKRLLTQAINENREEVAQPSREYTRDERIYMQGYTDALGDMLGDFNAEYEEFMENTYTPSLN